MSDWAGIVWLFVLSQTELSIAYPFVALGFIMTLFLGVFLLGESLTFAKVIGTLLVVAGVAIVSGS